MEIFMSRIHYVLIDTNFSLFFNDSLLLLILFNSWLFGKGRMEIQNLRNGIIFPFIDVRFNVPHSFVLKESVVCIQCKFLMKMFLCYKGLVLRGQRRRIMRKISSNQMKSLCRIRYLRKPSLF